MHVCAHVYARAYGGRRFLVNAYKTELKVVQQIFLENKDDPPLNDNQPPKAGAVAWYAGHDCIGHTCAGHMTI